MGGVPALQCEVRVDALWFLRCRRKDVVFTKKDRNRCVVQCILLDTSHGGSIPLAAPMAEHLFNILSLDLLYYCCLRNKLVRGFCESNVQIISV